ncbi:Pyridoxine-5'-phosphate oxidase [Fasciola gigantica]|uniref:pyridoxal 5'-phosphate synthase n=1 Tax=Fasciola gigantica TaxID=46835 RepID=A0A504Z901_FASGI|nr:Pyridoxine-5'-phosphate oxidase [Fasciola gigantica]
MPNFCSLEDIRVPYRHDKDIFDSINLKFKEPLAQFKTWFEDAISSGKVYEANAMVVATCTKSGFPSARYMLLKEVDERGFHFFSNYNSRKGQELEENPRASLLFYWEALNRQQLQQSQRSGAGELMSSNPFRIIIAQQEENPRASLLFYWEALNRQVRVEGTITRLSEQESEEYFHERPRESQISAAISPQSQVVPSRDAFRTLISYPFVHSLFIVLSSKEGGYVLYPLAVEFWQGQSNRLHDRIRFRRIQGTEDEAVASGLATRGEGDWCYERLAP